MQTQIKERHTSAAKALEQLAELDTAQSVVESLSESLTNLRDLLLKRVHNDIEARFGIDSMLAPMTASEEARELRLARIEIEVFQVVTAAHEMAASRYQLQEQWSQDWLLHLRLGEDLPEGIRHRADGYFKRTLEQRRLLFSNLLVRSFPEAHKAPLVIFRLFPKAIRLAVAIAFRDPLRASELRNEQASFLPVISDCLVCHGQPLESGDTCRECGNPLWKLNWLLNSD